MLDRKTKDSDASVELLKDKQKQTKHYFFVFYVIGVFMALSGFVIPYRLAIATIGAGLALLIVATWMFIGYSQYGFYLFLINKNIVKAVKEKEK